MPTKKPRSPQEKKTLSYANDRRNDYGENDKSSRKAIPARKAGENRKSRRKSAQKLAVIDQLAGEQADVVESSIRQNLERVGGWKKSADVPLKSFLERQAIRRSWRGLGPNQKS